MKKNLLTVGLGFICIGLLVIILLNLVASDRTAPEIIYGSEEVYYEDGMDTAILLEGVTATDNRDGDVSDSLIVKSVYQVGNQKGIVVYAAKDSANNVTTVSRDITYGEEPVDDEDGNQEGNVPVEDGQNMPEGDDENNGDGEGNQDEGESQAEIDARYEQLKEELLSQGSPFIRLTVHEVTLQRGRSFRVQNYLQELVDDEDDIDALSRRLRLGEDIDVNVPGVYVTTVYVLDTDGNISNMEEMVVTIE